MDKWKLDAIQELHWLANMDDWNTKSACLRVESMILDDHDIDDVTLELYPGSGGFTLQLRSATLRLVDENHEGDLSLRVRKLLAAVVAYEGEKES